MNNAVEFRNITKIFYKVVANKDISMQVHAGEILSLLGENGSGKTTLMNMLSGIYYPDGGEIYVNGKKADIRSPGDAYALGIGMVHQHFKLIDVFTAVENIALVMDRSSRFNLKQVYEKAREICSRYDFQIDLNQKVYRMSVSQKQTLEIIKVLFQGASILILDEPTAVLTPQETEKLFKVLRIMRDEGKTVIIITHKLHEVMEISDRVAILRKGIYVGSVRTAETNESMLTEMMVGEKVSLNIDRPLTDEKHLRLSVRDLNVVNPEGIPVLQDLCFDVFSGEILGVAGISGNGQKELLETIAGLVKPRTGSSIIYYPDDDRDSTAQELIGKDPKTIRDMGIHLSFVPEDRLGMGLVGNMGMIDNMMLKSYTRGTGPIADRKAPKRLAVQIRDRLHVVTPSVTAPVRTLSGGNVQKVLVGREIAAAPSVLMTAYAVRGLDINTSYTIYHLLNEQKQRGVAIIYVGEDLDVLLELCDRILVLCGGKFNGVVRAEHTTKEELGLLMTKMADDSKEGGKKA